MCGTGGGKGSDEVVDVVELEVWREERRRSMRDDVGRFLRGGGGMSSGWYTRSWKIVRGREEGSIMNSVGGRGGLMISPADSKNVVLGGADKRSAASFSSPVVAFPCAFFRDGSCVEMDGVDEESLPIRSV